MFKLNNYIININYKYFFIHINYYKKFIKDFSIIYNKYIK